MKASKDPMTRKRSSSSSSLSTSSDRTEDKSQKGSDSKKNKRELSKTSFNEAKETRRHSTNSIEKKTNEEDTFIYRDYSSIKVYSISKASSRERLRKKIEQSKNSSDCVKIDWDAIMA